jgi:hypothetical protein
VQDFYFIKNPPVENHVQNNNCPWNIMCNINIQNMPFKPQNKILIHHIQTKEHIKYYIRPWKTSCKTLFQPMRHVQDFFKKKSAVENHVQK